MHQYRVDTGEHAVYAYRKCICIVIEYNIFSYFCHLIVTCGIYIQHVGDKYVCIKLYVRTCLNDVQDGLPLELAN